MPKTSPNRLSDFISDTIAHMPAAQTRRSLDRRALVSALLVFLISWVAGAIIRRSYADLFFVLDDLDILAQIGLLGTGEMTWREYLVWPVGANPMAIWKLVALLEWKLFGLNPWWWHLVIGGMQASSASFLFLLLWQYLPGSAGPWLGSLFWGLAAIGHPDNPLILLCAGNFVLAMSWMLLAMVFVPRFAANPTRKSMAVIVGSVTLSLMTWGVMVALVPVVLFQYLLLERKRNKEKQPAWSWIIAWSIPALAALFFQTHWMLKIAEDEGRQRAFNLTEIVQRTVAQFGVSFRHLFIEGVSDPSHILVGSIALGTVGLLLFVRLWPFAHTLLILLFFYVAAVFLVLTNIGGVEAPFSSVVQMGHYHYIPVLFWCLTAGVILDQVAQRLGSRVKWAQLLCSVAILLLFASGQQGFAKWTSSYFDDIFSGMVADFEDTRLLLTQLSETYAEAEQPLVIPDFRAPIPTHVPNYCPLSAFAYVCFPNGLANIEFVPCGDASKTEVKTLEDLLLASSNPVAAACLDNLRHAITLTGMLRWLSDVAQKEQLELQVPVLAVPFRLKHSRSQLQFCSTKTALEDYVRYGFATTPPGFLDPATRSMDTFPPPPEELRKLISLLRINPDPEARYWEETYSQFLPAATGS